MKKCYVLICNCYSGEDSVSVFYNKEHAYLAMFEEMEVEKFNLQESGYKFESSENDTIAEVHVQDNREIYYEWEIIESTIQ